MNPKMLRHREENSKTGMILVTIYVKQTFLQEKKSPNVKNTSEIVV